MSLSFAVAMREQTVAHRSPPPSEPANRWFLRPRATGRMARSTGLLSSSMRPSSRHQDENDRFFVTDFGETLKSDSKDSVRDYALYLHEFVYEGTSVRLKIE